jgi:poly-gamma-glutamate synthesis protein (capsule biosynthesis protein)
MRSYHNEDNKIFFVLLGIALTAALVGPRIYTARTALVHTNNTASVIDATQTIPIPHNITLGFVGDVMLDRGVAYSVKKNFNGNMSALFKNTSFLAQPDIMFANLEGPASDTGSDLGNTYSFRMDPRALTTIKSAGVDVISFANNHVGDWGRAAFEDTITRAREAGLLVCGAGWTKSEAATPAIVDENGYRVGYLCFSDVGPAWMAASDTESGILLANDPNFAAIIQNARKQVNALVVSFHWGEEYKTSHTARQEELAHLAAVNGATIVVGHHPHVAEDTETYAGVPIIYSLGNFIFDQGFSKETTRGLFATATISQDMAKNLTLLNVLIDSKFVPHLEK